MLHCFPDDKFLMLLDLEGHCELLHCSSEEDTPVANALVHYFYEVAFRHFPTSHR